MIARNCISNFRKVPFFYLMTQSMYHKITEFTKLFIKRFFESFGLSISKYSEAQLIHKIASASNITMFVDIGANEGKVTENLIEAGYKGKVVCVEPLTSVNRKLSLKFSKTKQVKVLEPMALDCEDGVKSFKQSENLVSSSLKMPNEAYIYAAPASRIAIEQFVKTQRLDSVLLELVAANFKAKEERIMLKIDVQGSEADVLSGVGDFWDELYCIILETSFVKLYEDQILFNECVSMMENKGFEIWRIFPGHSDTASGRMFQCDVVFVKNEQSAVRGKVFHD